MTWARIVYSSGLMSAPWWPSIATSTGMNPMLWPSFGPILEVGQPDTAAATGAVLDDDRLAEVGLELLGQCSRSEVGPTAGRGVDDEGEVLAREARTLRGCCSVALGAGAEGKAAMAVTAVILIAIDLIEVLSLLRVVLGAPRTGAANRSSAGVGAVRP